MTITELCREAHSNAVNKGFYDQEKINIGEKLMLIVSELGEALEADRKNKYSTFSFELSEADLPSIKDASFENSIKDTFEDELADTVIRIADLCEVLGINLERHIVLKMDYNSRRSYKHGKKY